MKMNIKQSYLKRTAFTLVELLVVISIILILVAILIPNLRMITKERNIREAGRVVAALFAQASDRAVSDGVSGVVLLPNPNFLIESNGDGVLTEDDFQYAVTSMALLRRVPNYTGDAAGSLAGLPPTPAVAGEPVIVRINMPIEQTDLNLIAPGDSISFSSNSVNYAINEVDPDDTGFFLDLTLAFERPDENSNSQLSRRNQLPDPTGLLESNGGSGVPFVVRRAPRILESSTLELPAGHIVDLRFSGFTAVDTAAPNYPSRVFEPNPATVSANLPIALLFDETGALDRMGQNDVFGSNIVIPQSPLYLFVAEAESTVTGNPLSEATNLWVSVSNGAGTVNVGNNISSAVGNASLADLRNLFSGVGVPSVDPTCTDGLPARNCFNSIIDNARGDALIGSAGQ